MAFPNPHLLLLVFGAGFSGEEKGWWWNYGW